MLAYQTKNMSFTFEAEINQRYSQSDNSDLGITATTKPKCTVREHNYNHSSCAEDKEEYQKPAVFPKSPRGPENEFKLTDSLVQH